MGVVVHICNPKYVGGEGRNIMVQEKARSYLKNNLKQKGLEFCSRGRALA
jgi:hypothetical protein